MTSHSLSSFLEGIPVERVRGRVKREFEAARLIKLNEGRGPALVFQLEDAPQASAANLLDTREKLYKALGARGPVEAYKSLLGALESPGRLEYSGGPVLRESKRGLLDAPIARFYEKEAGYYLSSSIFIACLNGTCNASIHRILVLGENEGAVRIVPRHLWRLYREALKREGHLPVTIVIGVHPIITLASATSPRLGFFELELASRLLGGSLEVFESPIHKNPVPVGAAMVIEGRLTGELVEEGPYVDALGTYDRVRKQPKLRVEGVYINPDEYTHVILGGGLEHTVLMGFPREAAIWDSVSKVVPRVHKVILTPASGGWLHAVISIEKSHEGDAKNAIMAAFAAHPSLKHVVVVDPDIEVEDPRDVEWAIATRFQADKDLVIIRGARGSTLDPSGGDGLTSKLGIDATKPLSSGIEYERGRIPG